MTFLCAIFCGLTLAWGQDPPPRAPTAEELFSQGTRLYQSAQFAESAKNWESLARQYADQPALLHNWALAEFQAGRRGLAVALWRRALAVDPGLQAPRSALDYASRLMQLRDVDEDQWFERLRLRILGQVSLNQLLASTLLLLATGGWLLLGYLGRRRKAFRQESPLPPFTWVGAALSAGFVLALLLTGLKTYEDFIARGTAITATSVHTGPDGASSSLFELREGSDVILRQEKKGWTQIRYPGGMSGWVPNETLFQTSGLPLW